MIDYDLRRDLSTGQKSAITRLAKKHAAELEDVKQYLNRPDDFVLRPVSKKNAEILKKSGFKFMPGKQTAIIPRRGYDSVSIKGATIEYTKSGKKDTVYLSGDPVSLFSKAQKLQQEIKRNQLLTFKIGENSIASTRYLNLKQMKEYLRHVVLPRMRKNGIGAAEFWPMVSIVEIQGGPSWMQEPEKKSGSKGTPVRTRGKSR